MNKTWEFSAHMEFIVYNGGLQTKTMNWCKTVGIEGDSNDLKNSYPSKGSNKLLSCGNRIPGLLDLRSIQEKLEIPFLVSN